MASLYTNAIWIAFSTFVLMNVLTGPARWLLASSGLTLFIYIPILMIGAVLAFGTVRVALGTNKSGAFFLTCIMVLCAVISGMINVGSAKQVGFGLYVLWPFFFCMLFGVELAKRIVGNTRAALVLWTIVCFGVILNNWVTYPWEGFEYSVGDLELESSREWYSGDASKRLGGFSRASFDAAIQVALFSTLVLSGPIHVALKFVIAGISLTAIYFTNAKGMILSFTAMFALCLFTQRWLDAFKIPVLAGLGLLGMGLPIVAWIIEYKFDITGVAANPLIFSFTDRIENMWPEALLLMIERGTLWLGRGFGGIGVAQTYFENHIFNAADNIFVYAAVIWGLGVFPLACALIAKFVTRRDPDPILERTLFLVMTLVMVYGLTANVLENAPMAMALGILVRFCFEDTEPKVASS